MDIKKTNHNDNFSQETENHSSRTMSGINRKKSFSPMRPLNTSKKYSKKSRRRGGRFKKYKKVLIALIVVIVVAVVVVVLFEKGGDNFQLGGSDNIQVQTYYSRGSRDKEKKEQYTFSINDPIQIKINFKDMNDGDVVKVLVESKESGEVKQSVDVPVSSGEGSRFVSLLPEIQGIAGKYEIRIVMNVKGKDKTLTKTEFEIK